MKIFGYFLVAFAAASPVIDESGQGGWNVATVDGRGCVSKCMKKYMRDAMECDKYENPEATKCAMKATKKFMKCGTSC